MLPPAVRAVALFFTLLISTCASLLMIAIMAWIFYRAAGGTWQI
jgi:hypothetical protein